MKKILLILFLGMFLISLASAEIQTLGTFKQRECINLIQTCENCTYNNISTVLYPNSSVVLSNVVMTKDDTYYNYTFCNTSTLGSYIVNGFGDLDGEKTIWVYDFEVTPTGLGSNIGFYIIVLILSLGIIIFGVARNEPVITLLGSFGLYFLGLYILFNGIVGVKDLVTTWALGIITLGLAMYVSIRSAYSLITD